MKNKTIYLLIFLILVLIIIVILQNYFKKSASNKPAPSPSTKQVNNFVIVSTNLANHLIGITEPIKIEFSQPVPGDLIYVLDPKAVTMVKIDNNLNQLLITPKDAWSFDTNYTLTISKLNRSQHNQFLDQNYIYIFKTPPYSGI